MMEKFATPLKSQALLAAQMQPMGAKRVGELSAGLVTNSSVAVLCFGFGFGNWVTNLSF